MTTKILHLGLGPLGRQIVNFATERGMKILGAIDPLYAGQDLGELCGGQKSKTGPLVCV